MTTSADCGCDEAAAWKARAIRAEASLALTTELLRTVAERIASLLDVLPQDSDVVSTLVEPITGFDSGSPSR